MRLQLRNCRGVGRAGVFYFREVDAIILEQLRARGPAIHVRWESLLRVEPVTTPLANPDTLTRLIPDTVAKIFATLAKPTRQRFSLVAETMHRLPACECGNNPYLALYVAAEQAFVEALVLLQAEQPVHRSESDVAEVVRAVRKLARDEIDTFCGVCTRHGTALHCRHTAAAG
jgi:hypothetical protein